MGCTYVSGVVTTMDEIVNNQDPQTVSGFGEEWECFDQSGISDDELYDNFNNYFHIFPWSSISANSAGFDAGCGSGRWAKLVAPKVGQLNCLDASEKALNVARKNLQDQQNCNFHLTTLDDVPIPHGSMDFGYCLGVLHHIPDTEKALHSLVGLLKPGAPLLIYIYYAFDNRPHWFQSLWKITDVLRYFISRLPFRPRYITSQIIAITIYYPFARLARAFESIGVNTENFPLSSYRNSSLYTMRTDALDRFGTRLEKRYTREQIKKMLIEAGLDKILFSETEPFWCAIGYRKKE